MAFGVIGAVVEAIIDGPEGGPEWRAMAISGLDPADPSKQYGDLAEHTFQYWPESISDTIEIGWSFKEIPGASSALAQWGSNNGRTITFEVQLSRFMRPQEDKEADVLFGLGVLGTHLLTTPEDKALKDNRPHNVDIRSEVQYLRGYCYPLYKNQDDMTLAYPPPIAILNIPGLGLNESGGDTIFAVMTTCDVTYTLLFPDGTPRRATVAMTFRQIVQKSDGVFFKGWESESAPYLRADDKRETGISPGGGFDPPGTDDPL